MMLMRCWLVYLLMKVLVVVGCLLYLFPSHDRRGVEDELYDISEFVRVALYEGGVWDVGFVYEVVEVVLVFVVVWFVWT